MKPIACIRASLLLSGLLLLTSCSSPGPVAQAPRFNEAEAADFIARYYSDDTSYSLKPPMVEGAYETICDRARLLKLAAQQPRHDLAVVVLVHYMTTTSEDAAKLTWVNDLKALGYQRIVFLRAGNSMQVNGLPILGSAQASPVLAGK